MSSDLTAARTDAARGRQVQRFWFGPFRRAEGGAVAVEYALLALPLFLLLFAILETGLIFVAEQTLEHAVSKTGREVRVGDVPSDAIDCAHFRRRLCTHALLFNCADVKIDLRSYASYRDIPRSAPIRDKAFDGDGLQCQRGGPKSIMALRVFYEWPLVYDPVRRAYSRLKNGKYLISATAAFVTEPY